MVDDISVIYMGDLHILTYKRPPVGRSEKRGGGGGGGG